MLNLRHCLMGLALAMGLVVPARAADPLPLVRALAERGEWDLVREQVEIARTTTNQQSRLLLDGLDGQARAELALADGDEAGFHDALTGAVRLLANQSPASLAAIGPLRAELLLRRGQRLNERARLENQPAERQRAIGQATELLEQAEKAFSEAIAQLEPLQTGERPAAEKTQAQIAQARAILGRGRTLLEQARLPGLSDEQAGRKLIQAGLALEKLATQPGPSAWPQRAEALIGYANQGIDSRRAEESYQKVLRDRRIEAAPAQRDVRYFQLQSLWQSVQGGRRAERERFVTDARTWLADYAEYRRSPQGYDLRWQLSIALLDEIAETPDAERNQPLLADKLQEALRHLEVLATAPSVYRRQAERELISAQLLAGTALPPIATLRTFAECFQRLRLDLLRLNRATQAANRATDPTERAAHQAQRKQLLEELTTGLKQAQALAPAKADGPERLRWQQLQFDVLATLGQLPEAASIGERIFAENAGSGPARQAAEQTLRMLQILDQRGSGTAEPDWLAFAQLILAKDPSAPAADQARELLGQRHYQRQEYAAAADLLEKVSANAPRHAWCQFQAGLAKWGQHLAAMREANQPSSAPSPLRDQAIALMTQALPACEKDAETNPSTAPLAVNYRFILADLLLRLGDLDGAIRTIEPLVGKVEKRNLPADLPASTGGQVLSLALRAEVLKDPASPNAQARLIALQKVGEQGGLAGLAEQLRDLGDQLAAQIAQLEKDEAAADKLRTTRERFRQFLIKLEELPKVGTELSSWLAGHYLRMGDAEAAARLYAAVPAPAAQAPAALVQDYRLSRLQWLTALRLAVEQAEAEAREQKLLRYEQAVAEVMQEEWAKRHPVCLKESIHALQLRGQLGGVGGAIEQWDRLRQALEPLAGRSAMYRQVYQDCHFNLIVCLNSEAGRADAESKTRLLGQAAQLIRIAQASGPGDELAARLRVWLLLPEQAELKALVEKDR